jgi:CDP-diacylglycerol--serine O-phosphatidyltransferase
MEHHESRRRRGIYLLPNLFTTAALFAGFYAIVSAMNDRFEHAAVAIFVAMILDGLDGRVARMTNTQSEFGAEYDSLSDMVSFGLAPSLVMYQWALQGMGKLGWIAAFIYAAGAALRLARFNTQIGIADKRFFQGLASPAAAAIVTGMVWVGFDNHVQGSDVRWFAFVLTVAAGLLMVSNFRYYSFKDINLRGKVPFVAILAIVLLFVIYSLDTPSMLFLTFLIYAISGPIVTVLTRRHPAPAHHAAPAKGKDEESEENEE